MYKESSGECPKKDVTPTEVPDVSPAPGRIPKGVSPAGSPRRGRHRRGVRRHRRGRRPRRERKTRRVRRHRRGRRPRRSSKHRRGRRYRRGRKFRGGRKSSRKHRNPRNRNAIVVSILVLVISMVSLYTANEVTEAKPVEPIDDNQIKNVTLNPPNVPETLGASTGGNQSPNVTSSVPSAPKSPIGDVLGDDCEICKQYGTPADVLLPERKPKKHGKRHSHGQTWRRGRRGRGRRGSRKRHSRKHRHRRHRNSSKVFYNFKIVYLRMVY